MRVHTLIRLQNNNNNFYYGICK